MIRTITAIFALLFLTAFSKNKEQPASLSLYNTKWMLTRLHTAAGIQKVAVKKAFIKFDAENNRAGGNGSCNSFGGSFTVKDDSLSLSRLVSTKMYCADVQQTEDNFFALLGKVNRFEIREKSLYLMSGKEILLELESE